MAENRAFRVLDPTIGDGNASSMLLNLNRPSVLDPTIGDGNVPGITVLHGGFFVLDPTIGDGNPEGKTCFSPPPAF